MTMTKTWAGIFFVLLLIRPGFADQRSESLVERVQPFVEREELAGAVMLVASQQQVLAVEAVGAADREAGKAMSPDSMFWIASQSKPITAAALMMLADEGKLSVEDPVEKYLPEFRGQMVVAEKSGDRLVLGRPDHPIKIREILSHTSGLPFATLVEQPTLDLYPLSARVRSYAMAPLEFQPSTKYQYSNCGINTAGRIIEVVSGRPYEQFLDERLLKPLGMTDTTFWPNAVQAERIAKSYKPGPENKGLEATQIAQLLYPLSDRVQRFPMPAGGLFSTAADVARFYQMLLGGGEFAGKRYLSPEAVAQLTSRQTPDDVGSSYGFGFSVNGESFGHGGAYSTNSTADRNTGLILIWLVQHAGFPGDGAKAQGAFREAAISAYSQRP